MSSDLPFEIPSYMNRDYFENVLRQHTGKESIVLDDILYEPASKAGDGFESTIFRVVCTYHGTSKEKTSWIVKTVPVEEGLKKHMFNQEKAYATEIKMYVEVLPEMERILAEVLDNPFRIGPKLIHSSLKPDPVLILEDLVAIGCEMPDTTFGLDDSLIIIKRLAQFHAASIVVNERRLDLTNIRNSFFHIDKTKDFNIAELRLQPSVEMFIEAVEVRKDYEPVVVDRLKYFVKHYVELLEDVYVETDKKKYFVLTHNDYHRKNMLFKMVNHTIDQFYLFDYQFCLWSTPVIDLFYFFYQVSSIDTRQKHKEALLASYFNEYQRVLQALNCTSPFIIPTLEHLKHELLIHKAAEVSQIINFYKFQFMRWTEEDLKRLGKLDHMTQTKAIYASNEFHKIVKPELERLLLDEGF